MGVCGPRIARGVLKCVKTDGPRYQLGCGDRNCHSQPAARIISVTDPAVGSAPRACFCRYHLVGSCDGFEQEFLSEQ